MQQRVVADQVRQRQRSDGMVASQSHPLVDILRRGQPLAQDEEGLVDHRAKDPVHDKRRGLLHDDALLAELLPPRLRDRQRFVRRLEAPDDFKQAHHRHGVEEMSPDEAVGSAGDRRHLGDAQA